MAILRLLDGEPENYQAVVITAYTIVDVNNNVVCGANSRSDAAKQLARYSKAYPEVSFYIN